MTRFSGPRSTVKTSVVPWITGMSRFCTASTISDAEPREREGDLDIEGARDRGRTTIPAAVTTGMRALRRRRRR